MKCGKESVSSEEELAERKREHGTSEVSWPRWNEMQPTDLREHAHRGFERRKLRRNPHRATERSWEYRRERAGVSRQKSQEWVAITEKGKAKESRGHEWGKQIHEGGSSSYFYTTTETSEQGSWTRWNEMQPADLREQAHRGSERHQMRRNSHCAAERFWEYRRGRDGVSRQKSPEWVAVEEKAKAKESRGQGWGNQIHDGGSSSCFYRAVETSKHGSWPRWNEMQPTTLREQVHRGSERRKLHRNPHRATERSWEYRRGRDGLSRQQSQEWAAVREKGKAKESRGHERGKQIHERGSSSYFYTATETSEQGSWPRWNQMRPTANPREQVYGGSQRDQTSKNPQSVVERSLEYTPRSDGVAVGENGEPEGSRELGWAKQRLEMGSSSSFYRAAETSEQVPLSANVKPSGESSVCPTTHFFMNPTAQPKVKLPFPPTLPSESRQFLLEVLGGTPGEGDEFTVERLHGGEVNMDQMMLGLLGDDDLDDDNIYAGASVQEINAFPVSKFQDTSEPAEPCVLCLEIPSLGDHIRHLPCLHKFHKDCVDRWLCRKSFCPLCRFSIR